MVGFPLSSRWTFLGCYHGCHQRNTHGHHGFGNLHGFGHQLGGTDTATLTIEVNDVAPSSIAYSPNSFTLTKGTAMTTTTPTSSGGAVVRVVCIAYASCRVVPRRLHRCPLGYTDGRDGFCGVHHYGHQHRRYRHNNGHH